MHHSSPTLLKQCCFFKGFFLISVSLSFFSCSKHKLTEDQERILGTWKWCYTATYDDNCYYDPIYDFGSYDTLYPKIFDYRVEFKKRGIVRFIKRDIKNEPFLRNSEHYSKSKLIIENFEQILPNEDYYRNGDEFYVKGTFSKESKFQVDQSRSFSAFFFKDSMMLDSYPHVREGCLYYTHNYFLRE